MSRDLSNADPVLIGLIGRAGTGKSEAAYHLMMRHGFVAAAFAAELKESCIEPMLATLGVDHAVLYEQRMKNASLPGYERAEQPVTPRQLMQEFGDAGRRCDPDWWLRLLAARLGLVPGSSPVHDRIVISDVRYPNEAAFIRSRGGVLVRLHRDQAAPVRAHSSESHIMTMTADIDLWNNGPTLHGLHTLLDGVLADCRVRAAA